MSDGRPATELYAALEGKLRRRNGHSTDTYIVRDEIAIEGYRDVLEALEAGDKAWQHWNDCDDCHSCDHCTVPACPPQSDQWCVAGSELLAEASRLQYEALARERERLQEVL